MHQNLDSKVHPRACGGNGNKSVLPEHLTPRSIPAPAGETRTAIVCDVEDETVHPRACGGNVDLVPRLSVNLKGPSPRLRGKHRSIGERSIPAPAKRSPITFRDLWTVHPRACGGNRTIPDQKRSIPAPAGETPAAPGPAGGPSPRLRGKPGNLKDANQEDRQRSIPAPAGETQLRQLKGKHHVKVHPRACGGNA